MNIKKSLILFKFVCLFFIPFVFANTNNNYHKPIVKPTNTDTLILKHDVKTLMSYYSPRMKWWQDNKCIYPGGCVGNIQPAWIWANAASAMANYELLTGDRHYQATIKNVYTANWKHIYPRKYFDDNLWWALALINIYEVTHDQNALNKAKQLVEYVDLHGRQNVCHGNGGIYWDTAKTQVGTIANMLYITANAKLYQITHKSIYRQRANQTWAWFQKSGLFTKDFVAEDHYVVQNGRCGELYTWHFTYNTGELLVALANLSAINHDPSFLAYGKQVANKSLLDYNESGIITEHCDNVSICARNAFLFKGLYAYDLALFAIATKDKEFIYQIASHLNYNLMTLRNNQAKSSIYAFNWALPVNYNKNDKLYNPADILSHLSAIYLELGNLLIRQVDNQSLIKSGTESLTK